MEFSAGSVTPLPRLFSGVSEIFFTPGAPTRNTEVGAEPKGTTREGAIWTFDSLNEEFMDNAKLLEDWPEEWDS